MHVHSRITRVASRTRVTLRAARDGSGTQRLTLLNPQRSQAAATPSARASHAPSAILPGYFVGDRIGGGGMADVFYGEKIGARGFRAPVAIKRVRLNPSAPDFEAQRNAFAFEAAVTGRLRHPNLVAGRDFIQTHGGDYLVCDFVEGWTLLEALRRASERRVRLSLGASIGLIASVASGLAEAHRSGPSGAHVLHGDISPTNIMVSLSGHTTVIDFGASSPLGEVAPRVQGKLAYMSPEQVRGQVLDAQSDVFSLCLLLWELVCWRRLRSSAGNEATRMIEAGEGKVPLLRDTGLETHPMLEAIIAHGTCVSPAQRLHDAGDLAEQLREVADRAALDISAHRLGNELRTLLQPVSATPQG